MKSVILAEHIGRYADQENRVWTALCDEVIPGTGDFFRMPSQKPWVAEIVGPDKKYGLERRFIKGKIDLSKSSGNGNRGCIYRFVLDEGRIYEVSRRVAWRSKERFFCVARAGDIKKITKEEVDEWLSKL